MNRSDVFGLFSRKVEGSIPSKIILVLHQEQIELSTLPWPEAV